MDRGIDGLNQQLEDLWVGIQCSFGDSVISVFQVRSYRSRLGLSHVMQVATRGWLGDGLNFCSGRLRAARSYV